MKEIGENLKEARITNGIALDEAAEDLNITSSQIENIESGNTRAFKDMYELKELVRDYAKYLGLDYNKILDDFNDFLFEKTTKISLKDLLEAKENFKKEEKKISSPYTNIPEHKKNHAPFVLVFLIIIAVLLTIYFILSNANTKGKITNELNRNNVMEELNYEFTY